MQRFRWWLVVFVAVLVVGAAMPSFYQPDPARRIAALEAKVEELANVVRRGKPAANMRDLRDGELFDAADGQVPVYDASVGKWRPGSAASGVIQVARLSWADTLADNSNETVGVSPAWTYNANEAGLTTPWGDGTLVPPTAGKIIATANIEWTDPALHSEDNGAGSRYVEFYGDLSGAVDRRMAVSGTGSGTRQSVTVLDNTAAGGYGVALVLALQGAGASRYVEVKVDLFFWPGA